MGKTTEQIAIDIDRTREDLRSNLKELESRVRDAADWRSQFGKHPGAMIGAAIIGGALISSLFGRR